MDPEVLISVVIPVKNGDHWLGETIPAILNQQVNGAIEIIAIDSGSTDNSLSILSSYPVNVIQINPGEFNHGLTRNLGVRQAKGKFVVMTVQDAKPISQFWLNRLLDGFVDENVAAVCGQQMVPHEPDKNPIDWYRPISKPVMRKYFFPVPGDFNKLSPAEKLSVCRWDDVNAMYKREILIQIPFRETDFAEDVLWAQDALEAGHAIVYNPVSQVEHYHHEEYPFAFQRNFIVQYHFYKYFGVLPAESKGNFLRILRQVKLLLKEPGFSLQQKWKWLRHNYHLQRAINKSNYLLLKTVKSGKQIDSLYKSICKSVPQATKLTDAYNK